MFIILKNTGCRHPQIVVSGQYHIWLLLKLVIPPKDSLTNGNQQDLTEIVRSSSLLQHKILKQSKKSEEFLSNVLCQSAPGVVFAVTERMQEYLDRDVLIQRSRNYISVNWF